MGRRQNLFSDKMGTDRFLNIVRTGIRRYVPIGRKLWLENIRKLCAYRIAEYYFLFIFFDILPTYINLVYSC